MIIAQPHRRSRQEIAAHDPTHLVQQIKSSTQQSGVSFGYMVAAARVESNLDPQARAKTSSASGLYQFTSGTWLNLVKTHGSKHGLEFLASQIDEQGRVTDPATRQAILELRHDPRIAIELGIDFTRDNRISLENSLNRRISGGELYLAHFMGASQAGQFLAAIDQNPNTRAADLFPKAAAANRSVFFDREGNAKTVTEILQSFSQKIDAKIAELSQSPRPMVPTLSAATRTTNPALTSPGLDAYGRFFMTQPTPLAHDAELWLRLLMPTDKDRSQDQTEQPNQTQPPEAKLHPLLVTSEHGEATAPAPWQLLAYSRS